MQYNGQYFEGANNIYRHLKEERNSLSVGPKWKVAAANAFAKMKAIGPKQKMIKETEILQSAKVMTK
jgi:hypothetical protein